VRVTTVACLVLGAGPGALAAEQAPLTLEAIIPLGQVAGRIDHLAIDITRRRLYVAELGNNSLGVVDLGGNRLLRRITGLREPQGVGYVPTTDTVFVANGADGTLRAFRGADLKEVDRIVIGDDPDNIQFDATGNLLYVGYGAGALGIVDPVSRKKIGTVPLRAHPEGFQLDSKGTQVFINIPDAQEIAVVDLALNRQVASWNTLDLHANYPMGFNNPARTALIAFRRPPTLVEYALANGAVLGHVNSCADADDVFHDQRRRRIYVSCGDGFVETFATRGGALSSIGRLPTVAGSRTSLFVPEADRLYLAVRATGATRASIWVLRPAG
jgi:hypothetical protein